MKPRFGAIGKHGSIAVTERFIRSMKDEALRKILLPLNVRDMQREVDAYALWYDEWRPHQALRGATPAEVRNGCVPACDRPRIEPRARFPLARGDPAKLARRCTVPLVLELSKVDGRDHLPIVALRRAA